MRTQAGVAVLHKGNFEVRVHVALLCPPAGTLPCFSYRGRRCLAARAWSSVSCCTRGYLATAAPQSPRRPSSEHVTNWRRLQVRACWCAWVGVCPSWCRS